MLQWSDLCRIHYLIARKCTTQAATAKLGKVDMEQRDNVVPQIDTPAFGLDAYAQILQNAPVAISITDNRGNLLLVNDTFLEVTGYSREELLGNNCSMLSYKATPRSVYESLWGAITRGDHWQGQLINKRKTANPILPKSPFRPLKITAASTVTTPSTKILPTAISYKHTRKTSTPCSRPC